MRWFVDVSPVGRAAPPDRYCFEAEQWQSAISLARTLRGENGGASVEIAGGNGELRALDPSRDLEYLASRAPDDAPVTSPPAAPSCPPPRSSSSTQRSLQAVRELRCQIVRERAEDPSAKTPLTYREVAYAIGEEATRPELEVLLWTRFSEIEASLKDSPPGKFVQVAVFDHVFDDKPRRAPVATLMWKDWRGEPVLNFTGSRPRGDNVRIVSVGETLEPPKEGVAARKTNGATTLEHRSEQGERESNGEGVTSAPIIAVGTEDDVAVADTTPAAAASASLQPTSVEATARSGKAVSVRPSTARPGSLHRAGLKPVSVRPPPAETVRGGEATSAEETERVASAPDTDAEEPATASPDATSSADVAFDQGPDQSASAPTIPAREPTSERSPAPQQTSETAQHRLEAATQPARDLTSETEPNESEDGAPGAGDDEDNTGPGDRETKPTLQTAGTRHQPKEDLIGELFDAMHDLHFMRDMVTGVEFVLGILTKLLPSQVALIHVFDINARAFVVVRAKGPGSHTLVLHRTEDQNPFFQTAMRRSVSTRIDDARGDDRFAAGRWSKVDCQIEAALFGPVNQGGRYLGAIELANPEGGGPFFESEAHALDYICEQFAEFLASRPLVLEDDVVLGLG